MACAHDAVKVEFDEVQARLLEEGGQYDSYELTREIRKRWPRFFGNCPDCGQQVIKYASSAHFVWGDW